jgi:UDP-galactopyranose mutase
VQPCVQINYPNNFNYTRSVEIKHVTRQKHANTVVSYEYSKGTGDPYYPIPSKESEDLYKRYKTLADLECQKNKTYFVGRLATYRYLNTDQALEMGIEAFNKICLDFANEKKRVA